MYMYMCKVHVVRVDRHCTCTLYMYILYKGRNRNEEKLCFTLYTYMYMYVYMHCITVCMYIYMYIHYMSMSMYMYVHVYHGEKYILVQYLQCSMGCHFSHPDIQFSFVFCFPTSCPYVLSSAHSTSLLHLLSQSALHLLKHVP